MASDPVLQIALLISQARKRTFPPDLPVVCFSRGPWPVWMTRQPYAIGVVRIWRDEVRPVPPIVKGSRMIAINLFTFDDQAMNGASNLLGSMPEVVPMAYAFDHQTVDRKSGLTQAARAFVQAHLRAVLVAGPQPIDLSHLADV